MVDIYGTKQILRTPGSTISLELESCDFNATEENNLGYRKFYDPQTKFNVEYNFFGVPVVSGGRYFQKKNFSWDLTLDFDKTFTLKALYDEQVNLVQNFNVQLTSNTPTYPNFYIELIDGRLAELEKDTLSRSYDDATAMGIGLPTSPIPGHSYRWFRYLIAFTEIQGLDNAYMPQRSLTSIQISGIELEIAELSNFPSTDEL